MRTPQFIRHAAVYSFGTLVHERVRIFLVAAVYPLLAPADVRHVGMAAERRRHRAYLAAVQRPQASAAQLTTARAGPKRSVAAWSVRPLPLVGRRRFVGGGIALVAGPELGRALEVHDYPRCSNATMLVMLLEAMSGLLMTSCQARLESGLFMGVTVGQFFVRVGLSIAFVAWCGWGIWGLLTAAGLTAGGTTLFLLLREIAIGGLWPDRRTLVAMAWFALPFVPGGLGFLLLHNGDRFFLMKYADAAALGLYALGYKLAFSVSQFSRSPLYMVWNTQMHQAAFREDAPDVFGRAFSRILASYLAVGLALCLLADEVAVLCRSGLRRGGAGHPGGGTRLLLLDGRRPDGLRVLCFSADRLEDADYAGLHCGDAGAVCVAHPRTRRGRRRPGHSGRVCLPRRVNLVRHATRLPGALRMGPHRCGPRSGDRGLAAVAAGAAGSWAVLLKAALWPAWALTLWCSRPCLRHGEAAGARRRRRRSPGSVFGPPRGGRLARDGSKREHSGQEVAA